MFSDLQTRLKDKQLTITVTNNAKEHIVEQAYDPIYGARPLKRYIQRNIETLIGRMIISNTINLNKNLEVDFDGEKLIINNK